MRFRFSTKPSAPAARPQKITAVALVSGRRFAAINRVVTASLKSLIAATLVVSVLGAPATAGPSEVLPDIAGGAAAAETREYAVTTLDGVTLRGYVHLPPGQGPFPTVLEYTPYLDNARDDGLDGRSTLGEFAYLRDAGYALARVAIRGTGRSDGCLQMGNHVDVADVALVIEDVARQRWSTGKVGMIGHSYPAWTQDMAVTVAPEPLKAVVPISGVVDLWNLLLRRGAPIFGGVGVVFPPLATARVSAPTPNAAAHLNCPSLPTDYVSGSETATSGDRTPWFEARDLRERITRTPVPMLRANGILSPLAEGHNTQIDGLWERLRTDRTHFVLGQWPHEQPPSSFQEGTWNETVLAWFDHYLRSGPKRVRTGVVEYEDDAGQWHTTDRWPPRSTPATLHLSGDTVVPDGARVERATARFVSADLDPGINQQEYPRWAVTACGPHQALYVSPPLAEDVRIAGAFDFDVTLESTLPGGNFQVALWKTKGTGSCPDEQAAFVGRTLMDLRHWAVEGVARDFPIGRPTSFRVASQPLASQLRRGERLVIAIGGGATELTPDPLHPMLTVHAGSLRLPVVEGRVRFGG